MTIKFKEHTNTFTIHKISISNLLSNPKFKLCVHKNSPINPFIDSLRETKGMNIKKLLSVIIMKYDFIYNFEVS